MINPTLNVFCDYHFPVLKQLLLLLAVRNAYYLLLTNQRLYILTYRPIRSCVSDGAAAQISHALDTQCNNEQRCCFGSKCSLNHLKLAK